MAKKKNIEEYYYFKRLKNKYPDCKYYIVFGERSNGKSYSWLEYATEDFIESGCKNAFGYIRRWKDDVTQSNMNQVFKNLKCNDNGENRILTLSHNKYNDVIVKNRCFYLVNRNEDSEIIDEVQNPLGYIFSLSESERIKSTGYPDIRHICFEEFIAEGLPMVNEFDKLMSVISTIVRLHDYADITLLGNTVNKYNIYFNEFGLYKAKNQLKNTVDIYEYPSDDGRTLKIACEYADIPNKKLKKSNIYFAFNNKNKMITEGAWKIKSYPHLTHFYTPKDIKMMYFIKHDNEIYQCEIIKVKDNPDTRIDINNKNKYSNKSIVFTYIHRKTTEIRDLYDHIIYQQDYSPHKNIRTNINHITDDASRFINSFFAEGKVVYQDNSVGDAIDSYRNWCVRH